MTPRDPTFWIMARASGLLAYLLLTTSVLAGIVVKARPFGRVRKPAVVTDLHRFLAMLGLGAIALHGSALVLDQTVHISPAALFVPGLVPYRPLWTALGVLAFELMVVVYFSFPLRRRIGTNGVAPPPLVHVRHLRTLHSPWAGGGDGLGAPMGARALRIRRGWCGCRRHVASSCSADQRRSKTCTG